MKLKKIMDKLEEFYPKYLAFDWDKIGLQIGSENKEVKSVLTALEITNEVIEEAIDKKVDLIIAHHPIIFNSINELNYENETNKKIINLIKNDIAVYVLHTNFDIANGGMNDWICEILGVKRTKILKTTTSLDLYSIEIEVDIKDVQIILETLPKLSIGKNIKGNTNYLMGPKIKRYKSSRINESTEKDVVLIQATATHEQIILFKKYLGILKTKRNIIVNFNVFKLEGKKIRYGLGRVGLIKPLTLEQLVLDINKKFSNKNIKFVGSREKVIKKVAVVGGSGADYDLIDIAKESGADAYITGDVNFHQAQYAKDKNIALIDASHYMEIVFNDGMSEFLNKIEGIKVYSSEIDSNPFEVI